MRVKVTPPYEGAGSWKDEVIEQNADFFRLKNGMSLPREWCEPIPEIAPEPGDICEFFNPDGWLRRIGIYVKYDENLGHIGGWRYVLSGEIAECISDSDCRVLARKPKEFDEVRDACHDFSEAWENGTIVGRTAYERFLSAILGTEYGRIE